MGHMKEFDLRIRQGGDDAIAAVSELLEGRWIPVSERLPIETPLEPEMDYHDVWVLACHRGEVCEAMFARTKDGDYWQVPDFGEVTPTHWMPLPEPPQAK